MIIFEKEKMVIENRHCRLMIDRKGNICSLTVAGEEKNRLTKQQGFCVLCKNGEEISPVRADFKDNTLSIAFDSGYQVVFRITDTEDFITFELLTELGEGFDEMRYVCLSLDNKPEFSAVLYSMNVNTNVPFYPDALSNDIFAVCCPRFGIAGSKCALIASEKAQHREIMKKVCDATDPQVGMVSKAGGAYALDFPDNYGDYVLIMDARPEKMEEQIAFFTQFGIDQFDFHQSKNTFRQGDFRFLAAETAEEFKEKIADPLKKKGILSGLHTYAYYIDYEAEDILTNPKWQRDLEVLHTLTLAEDISDSDRLIMLSEDTSNISTDYTFFSHNSPLVLIEEEIIQFTLKDGRLTECDRGFCKTKKAPHSKGCPVKFLGGQFNMLAPVPGSALFYEIARRTADAYNRGGFGMIYMDALDGMGSHTGDFVHYAAMFVHAVLKQCNTDPVFEYSIMFPALWYARGRLGAWDVGRRAYKEFIRKHIRENRESARRYCVTTLGWYHFWLVDDLPANYSSKHQYTDDVDYMGVQAIAHDCTIVYIELHQKGFEEYAGLRTNMRLYTKYNNLRKQMYFSEEIKAYLRKHPEKEYTLVEKGENHYALAERVYVKQKVRNGKFEGYNPFEKQQPFVRIEGLYSTLGEDPIELTSFDDSVPIREQNLSVTLEQPVDLREHLAIKVRVHGNNSNDVLCVCLTNNVALASGLADYYIPLNFEGWKDFIIAEVDNGDYNHLDFGRSGLFYNYYHQMPFFEKINSVTIYTSGNCDDVYVGKIEAVKHFANVMTNPMLQYGDKQCEIETTFSSGEYIEISDGQAFKYDCRGKRTPATLKGWMPEIESGQFEATFVCCEVDKGEPRVKLTFGFTGQELV